MAGLNIAREISRQRSKRLKHPTRCDMMNYGPCQCGKRTHRKLKVVVNGKVVSGPIPVTMTMEEFADRFTHLAGYDTGWLQALEQGWQVLTEDGSVLPSEEIAGNLSGTVFVNLRPGIAA